MKTTPSDNHNDILTGNAAANVLQGGAGNDTLIGGAGNDTLDGGTGADTMTGGAGNDLYYVDNSADVVTELAGEGIDTVRSSITYKLGDTVECLALNAAGAIDGSGNALANTLYAGAGDNVLDGLGGTDMVSYFYAGSAVTVSLNAAGAQATGGSGFDTLLNFENLTGSNYDDVLTGSPIANMLSGGAGHDTLFGGLGNDTLNGGTGVDSLAGGAGNDTYVLSRGYGTDRIIEDDATIGNSDVALFGPDITADQLWFRQEGDDLEVSVIGTSDKFLIEDWYVGTQHHVEQFKTSDGHALLERQVQSLVEAMASFSPPPAGQTTLPPDYRSTLDTLIASNWK